MQKTKILAIAPYEGLREVLQAEAANRADIEMDVYVGDLADGVAIAKALEGHGYDIILSRGGTARMIEGAVELPVVDVVPTVYDLLRFVRLAENMPGRFAVVGFSDFTRVADKLFDLIGREIEIISLRQPADADIAVARLEEQGFSLIIGDAIAVSTAKKRHMNSILIASGEESVQAALSEAVRIREVVGAAIERNLRYRDILDHSSLSIVVCDEGGRQLYSNLSQDQMEYQRVFRALPEYVPAALEHGEFRIARRSKGYLFEVTGRAIVKPSGRTVAFYIERRLNLPQLKAGVLEYYHMLDFNGDEEDNHPIDNVGSMAPVMESARRFGQLSAPVALLGAPGVPFDDVMRAIYRHSALSARPLIVIDCALIDEKSFGWLLESIDSPLCETRMTICLKHFSLLSDELQQRYMRFAQFTALHKRNRLIYSIGASRALSEAAEGFFNDPELVLLHLPPLRERPGDILSLANLCLSALNIEMGRQAIGFSEGARALLNEYDWPGSNDQLYRVVRRCLIRAQADSISEEDVREALGEERQFPRGGGHGFALEGTLEEIGARVVRAVLEEENMNRTRAAERLGISRSTLWRMLR